MYDLDLIRFFSDWLTYAVDNAKGLVPQRLSKVLDFMSLYARKYYCGDIFACYLHYAGFPKTIRCLSIYLELTISSL